MPSRFTEVAMHHPKKPENCEATAVPSCVSPGHNIVVRKLTSYNREKTAPTNMSLEIH